MSHKSADTYQSTVWRMRAAERLANDVTLSHYANVLLDQADNSGVYSISEYQWISSASYNELADRISQLS